jgi:hypothetical protein
MTGWPDQPMIYEINTAVWLDELSRAAGRPVTLAGVGAADWDAAVPAGVDAVWPMGVWGRSPAGLGLRTPVLSCRPRSLRRSRTCGTPMSSGRRTAYDATSSMPASAAPMPWPWRGPPWRRVAHG